MTNVAAKIRQAAADASAYRRRHADDRRSERTRIRNRYERTMVTSAVRSELARVERRRRIGSVAGNATIEIDATSSARTLDDDGSVSILPRIFCRTETAHAHDRSDEERRRRR